MDEITIQQFHLLNFFRVKNDFASSDEVRLDFRKSGLDFSAVEFGKLIESGYFEKKLINGRFAYKINEDGFARLSRLKNDYELAFLLPAEKPKSQPIIPPTKSKINIKIIWNYISTNLIISGIIAGLIVLFIWALIHHYKLFTF